jgi:hypothetical protein
MRTPQWFSGSVQAGRKCNKALRREAKLSFLMMHLPVFRQFGGNKPSGDRVVPEAICDHGPVQEPISERTALNSWIAL